MMRKEDEVIDDLPRELIIIRRGGGDDFAAPKGGAWKIAYADFVTAMMAFFLVMWLINSANEATKARVASYFNPIKMTDATPSGRGIVNQDSSKRSNNKDKKSPQDSEAKPEKAQDADLEQPSGPNPSKEEDMMSSPFKALDNISDQGMGQPSGRTVEIATQKSGDPFDPQVWEALRNGTKDDAVASADPDKALSKVIGKSEQDAEGNDANADTKPRGSRQSKAIEASVAELKEALDAIQERLGGQQDFKFDVKLTDEGILIVLEDGEAESMFRIGSAEPSPALVMFIGSIGHLLEEQEGGVIIRGHTDARKFQTAKFDNWQLSTARAHMASYMLIRGGLSESRVRKIEGHGAAQLLDASDPLSEINRRVEFVLVPKSK